MASRSSGIPDGSVYFVKSASMASIAARFTKAGVGKSGSPGPKSTTSTPRARRRPSERRASPTRQRARRGRRTSPEPQDAPGGPKGAGLSFPDRDHQHLETAPARVDEDHQAAGRGQGELNQPKHEQNARLERAQVEVHEQEPAEETLEERQEDFVALVRVEHDRGRGALRDRIDDRNEGGENRPLVDRRRDEIHDGHRRLRDLTRPVEGRELFGKLGKKRRDPLHENEL